MSRHYPAAGGTGALNLNFDIKKKTVLKALAYFGTLCLVAVLQTAFFSRFGLFDVTPDMMCAAVVTIAVFEGERSGGIAGVAAGFLIESVGSFGLALSPLPYMLCGYLCGLCCSYVLNRNFASWTLCILLSFLFREVFTLAALYAAHPDTPFLYALRSVLLPEYLSSVLTAPLLYLGLRPIARLFHRSRSLS